MNIFRNSPNRNSPDFKRPPLRQSNGVYTSPGGRKYRRSDSTFSKYVKPVCSFLFYTTLITTITISAFSLILYVNCSNTHGYEIIPKSHQLCHDLYQFLQTGHIGPMTWDYKASFTESIHRVNHTITSTGEWIKNFDFVAVKDAGINFIFACRDTIMAIPFWIYDNACHLMKSSATMATEFWNYCKANTIWAFQYITANLFDSFVWLKRYTRWAFYYVAHRIIDGFELIKFTVFDFFNYIYGHLEQLKKMIWKD